MRLALLVPLLLSVGIPASAQPPDLLVLGHRGFAWNRIGNPFPENTILSVRAALAAGADGVEIDVIKSADGVMVMRHDDALATTSPDSGIQRSNCSGRISQKTWAQLQRCRAQPHSHSGISTPLDRLEQLLDIPMRFLVIDVKDDGARVNGVLVDSAPSVGLVVRAVIEADAVERAILMLHDPASIRIARIAGVRACLKRHRWKGKSPRQVAAEVDGIDAWGSCVNGGLARRPLMTQLNALDRRQVTYLLGNQPTLGYDRMIQSFIHLGVYAAIVDQIEHVVRLRDG